MSRYLAIGRSPRWSPGLSNPSRDAAILDAVIAGLRSSGHEVTRLDEDSLLLEPSPMSVLCDCDAIFSMARSLPVLMLLQRCGTPCVNSPRGVMHTAQSREDTLTLLQAAGLPIPPFWAYEAADDEMFMCEPHLQRLLPAWIKAMHPQGVHEGDVRLVSTALEADTCLLERQAQGYSDIIAMQHVAGQLVKCYAVVHEEQVLYVSHPQYASMAQAIARCLDLQVFGFDLIVDAGQQPWIIDVNDWPSFSSVREEVSPIIVKLLCLPDTNQL